jgi:hypothetical protein
MLVFEGDGDIISALKFKYQVSVCLPQPQLFIEIPLTNFLQTDPLKITVFRLQ